MRQIPLIRWLAGTFARRTEHATDFLRTSMTPDQLSEFRKALEERIKQDVILRPIRRNYGA